MRDGDLETDSSDVNSSNSSCSESDEEDVTSSDANESVVNTLKFIFRPIILK